jgi:hypothetical protein
LYFSFAISSKDSASPYQQFLSQCDEYQLSANSCNTAKAFIIDKTNNLIYYRLEYFLAGTYTGANPSWTNVNSSYSVSQYAPNLASGYNNTNAITLDQGYFYGRGSNTFSALGDVFTSQVLQVTSNIINESDILVLTGTFVTTGGGSANTFGTIKWQELY